MSMTASSVTVLRQRLGPALTLNNAQTAFVLYIVASHVLRAYRHIVARGIIQSSKEAWTALARRILLLAIRLVPSTRKRVEFELGKAKEEIRSNLIPSSPGTIRHLSLPAQGQTPEWIVEQMDRMDGEIKAAEWKHGKISGAVYHGGEDMEHVIVAAFRKYIVSNPLHPDVFPAVRKMEAEIISMCLRMYNGPNGAGTTTGGGTESILMSVKTHRDWARDVKGITRPEIIIPVTAHAAFYKAGDYFGVKVHEIAVDPATRKVDVNRVRRAINGNTIMLVGSAVNFPDGNMDDIVALATLAKRYSIGMHVDCCLGSFIMPFLEKAGFPVEPFDFRVDGVTAISCDTHKYGFAPKGSSVIMYRSAELRRYQYYVQPDWIGGVYASPSIAGSRPGALVAGTWAAMNYMGYEGYLRSCTAIVGAAKAIEAGIRADIPELYILGSPPASVVAFGSQVASLNVHEIGDIMSKRGWHLNALTRPAALHIACTRLTVPAVDQFLADLKDAVHEAKSKPSGQGQMVMLYGLGTSSAVGPTMVSRLATSFLDALFIA